MCCIDWPDLLGYTRLCTLPSIPAHPGKRAHRQDTRAPHPAQPGIQFPSLPHRIVCCFSFFQKMADTFSVAGTAVGIISLGIQTCKGIVWYIDTAKDAKEKAERLRREVEQLADILESLETTVTQADLSSTSTLTVTHSGISACASALEQIKKRLDTPSSLGQSRIKTRIQVIKARLSYPFKEGDLVYWKNALDHVQQHLQTALLALQMCVHPNTFDTIDDLHYHQRPATFIPQGNSPHHLARSQLSSHRLPVP
jgi:hypothetical protein